MKLALISNTPASRSEWEQVCRDCSYATFFHTPFWTDIAAIQYHGMTTISKKICFNDGKSAIIPLVQRKLIGGLVSIDWSMPMATYGGWISSDELTEEHAEILAKQLYNRPDLVWRQNPLDPNSKIICTYNGIVDTTQSILLTGDWATVSSRFTPTHNRNVRKAVSSGVIIREAISFDEWGKYNELYNLSRDRWNSKGTLKGRAYNRELFETAFNLDSKHRKLWLALLNDVPIAGMLCFYWNTHAVYWHGSGDANFFPFRPNNILYETAIHNSHDLGYTWFDCNPSGGLSGVEKFKEHLGALKYQARLINKRSPLRVSLEYLAKLRNNFR